MPKKVVVVDLDGTLLDTNTFHKWLIFLFKKSLLHNPAQSIRIIYNSLLRILKVITHKQLKYNILKISEDAYYVQYIDSFVEELGIYLNEEVLQHIEEDNTISILATAAPELYANAIAQKYRFSYCIATPYTTKLDWYENIKENKKKSLEILLDSIKENKVDIVISDHHDDIPIMKLARDIYLINASSVTNEKVTNAGLKYT